MAKIFGIGLNKTGTTTLGSCLKQLGYRHSSFSLELLEASQRGDWSPIQRQIDAHDSFEDWPYPLLFERLDQLYPGSLFILSRRRCAEVWLQSLMAHAMRVDPVVGSRSRQLAYGYPYPQLNPAAHMEIYERHLERVRQHFRQRPQQLLEVCWEEEASWHPLCGFLGQPVPQLPFPHANRAISANPERLAQNQSQLRRLGGAP